MKYTFRKFRMMHATLKYVKGDKCRTNETKQAIIYIFKHPSFLFQQKHLSSQHNCILKAVNVIVNYPYFDDLYYSVIDWL